MSTFRRALVRPPAANFADGLTTVSMGAPDVALALAQHEAYCEALLQCGLTLTRLPADARYPDSTFVEDTAILTPNLAVITRPGAPSRAREVDAIRNALEVFYPDPGSIEAPGTVDGGDVCEAADHFFIGISKRTNEEGARQLAKLLAAEGFATTLVDIRNTSGFLHLKSALAWIGADRLVVTEALAGREEFWGWKLVRTKAEEEYAANCVLVNGHVLIAEGFPAFEAELKDLGIDTVPLDMSEFRKMDGGLSCLSLRF